MLRRRLYTKNNFDVLLFIVITQMVLIMILLLSVPYKQESIKRLKMENELLKKQIR